VLTLVSTAQAPAQPNLEINPERSQVSAQPSADLTTTSGWGLNPVPGAPSMYCLDFTSTSSGWAGGSRSVFIYWNGTRWSPTSAGLDSIITGVDYPWAVTHAGEILHYTGGLWEVDTEVEAYLDGIAMSGGSGWAVGGQGKVYRYSGGWSQFMVPGAASWFDAVDMVTSTAGWIVGTDAIFRWTGASWQSQATLDPGEWLHDVDMLTTSDGWAVGEGGILYHYDGSAWTKVDSPTTNALNGVSMVASDNVWAVGNSGTILHYDGTGWSQVDSPTTITLQAIHMWANEGWAVGELGTVLRYLPPAEISAHIENNNFRASPGEIIEYTITVENSGVRAAASVVVSDAIPVGTTYVPDSAVPPPTSGPDPLVWELGTVEGGEQVVLTFQVQIDSPALNQDGEVIVNWAEIEWFEVLLERLSFTLVGEVPTTKSYVPLVYR
jgi:uncharacterized repeat protein (TIGR01451 family)